MRRSGDQRGEDDERREPSPCFRNTLSSGDKTTLAFAFFLARLELDPDIEDKVVLFDDPISSLDCFRRASTRQAIKRVAQRAKQVIVLSHDPFFLRDIWEHTQAGQRQALCVTRTTSGSRIAEWDICEATRTAREQHYFTLKRYLELGPGEYAGDLQAVACSIRPLLEGYVRSRCPGVFGGNQWLGDMVQRIATCEPSDRVYCLKPLLGELTDIKEYSAPFHHDKNPSADTHPVTDGELSSYVRRTLALLCQ